MTETPIEYEQLQQTSFDQHHARTTKRRKRFLHSARTVLSWNSWGLVFQLFRAEQARTHEQIKAPSRQQQQQQRRTSRSLDSKPRRQTGLAQYFLIYHR